MTWPQKMNSDERQRLLSLSDEELARECRCEHYIDTGKGGQKRNKTSSAVRFTHKENGIVASCAEERQQSINKLRALRALRLQFAFQLRCPPCEKWTGQWQMNVKNPQYPQLVAFLLDTLEDKEFRTAEAAGALGLSTGKLISILARDPQLWQLTNSKRQQFGHKPLKKK